MTTEGKCPVMSDAHRQTAVGATANQHWWPNQLNLKLLQYGSVQADPIGEHFNYAEEFKTVDLTQLKQELETLMTTSQDWWPADYGHYGPFFIRMAWHSAGTYRIGDGRGGAASGSQRFAPLNSWPDNVSLDKARRLLWPLKQKYGRRISWADLMIFAGNCALDSMGLKTFGFAGGRVDVWEPEDDIYWGPETTWLGDERYTGDRQLENPLGAVQMGLIYVNPEGPNGTPDPVAAGRDIRCTFGRMAMNDEETVALIAGGHTFGKAHGAADPDQYVGREPEAAGLEEQGLGWKNTYGTGHGDDTISSGLEGAWTRDPIKWDNNYFDNLFGYEWEQTKSPAGATQWIPKDGAGKDSVPGAHDASKRHVPIMFTTDLSLKMDPDYRPISKRFHENPDEFADVFARAWYKLTHRDMGPRSRFLGALVPAEPQLFEDPVPPVSHALIDAEAIAELKGRLLQADLSISQLVSTAWASASTFRGTDKRGGANGARLRLEPQKNWDVNDPTELAQVIQKLEQVQQEFNQSRSDGKQVSLADVIVLGGCAAVEEAARNAGCELQIPFSPGRTDASQDQTDVESFAVLEPTADGFRNYIRKGAERPAEQLLVERANLLTLTAPEMTVLIGGMRVLNANTGRSEFGLLTSRTESLTNDFFVNLLDMKLKWQVSSECEHLFEGRDRETDELRFSGTSVDLVFGSNSQLRAISEVYASDDGQEMFIRDFGRAWAKVMNLDRFDLS